MSRKKISLGLMSVAIAAVFALPIASQAQAPAKPAAAARKSVV